MMTFFTQRITKGFLATIVAPVVIFAATAAPLPVYAAPGLGVPVGDWITEIKTTLSTILEYTIKMATYAQYVNTYFLEPLAFVEAGKLTQAMTAGAVGFVIGQTNGTGVPQFVTDLQQTSQTVADSGALSMLNQTLNSNLTFKDALAAELGQNYAQQTTLAGYWAANMNTLAQSSPNPTAYLNGNWTQGGTAAWLALTTQIQNNPYAMYEQTQEKLSSYIGAGTGGTTGARITQLNQGQGFMGWCGPASTNSYSNIFGGTTITASGSGGMPVKCAATGNCTQAVQACTSQGGTVQGKPTASSKTITCVMHSLSAAVGAAQAGDPCINPNGTAGVVKTPGSVIAATLNKTLGAKQDQIVRMGNVGPEINQIIGNLNTVVQTAQIANALLGGGSNTGGLLGSAQTQASGRTPLLTMLANSNSTLGVTAGQVYQNQASSTLANSTNLATRVSQYATAWGTITHSVTAAATALAQASSTCAAAAQSAQNTYNAQLQQATTSAPYLVTLKTFIADANATTTAINQAYVAYVEPANTQIASASSTITQANAMVSKMKAYESMTSPTSAEQAAYSQLQTQAQTAAPTDTDVSNAQGQAQQTGRASASPSYSLNVSGGSIVDQMGILATNADATAATCVVPSPPAANTTP